jgi:signal recognition particle subunit SEC65
MQFGDQFYSGYRVAFAVVNIDEFVRKILPSHQIFLPSENCSDPGENISKLPKQLQALINSKQRKVVVVWAILDRLPPVKCGVVATINEVLEIAKSHGIDGFAHQSDLDLFAEFVSRDHNIISHMTRPNGLYSVCIWKNNLQYLCDVEPVLKKENISKNEFTMILLTWGGDMEERAGMWQGGYIRNYIRRREAKRKLSTPKPSSEFHRVEFLYSPEWEWLLSPKKWKWQRHRIVKKTNKFIFVEEQPYFGTPYLKDGWQAFIVYTIMIDRVAIELQREFHHQTRHKTFFEESAVPKTKYRQSFDYEYVFESIYEDWDSGSDSTEPPSAKKIREALRILGLKTIPKNPSAVKNAYRPLAQKWHSDRMGGSHEVMSKLNKAKDDLLNEIKKKIQR